MSFLRRPCATRLSLPVERRSRQQRARFRMDAGGWRRAIVAALLSLLTSNAYAQRFEAISIPLAYEGHQIELAGRFEKPAGTGPFPAAILLHGCEGYQVGLWHTTMMA